MTPIDIRPADLDTVRRILREHVPAVEVRAFGSRVAWTARETSDLDLALMTDTPLSIDRTAALRAAFTESDLPICVDVVDWASTSEAFRKVIEADYVVLDCNRRSSSADWTSLTLADACSAIDYGLTASASNERGGPKFLRITDIVSEQIDWNSVPYVAAANSAAEKYRLHHGDIVVARTGASTGASAYIKNPPRAVFASYLVRLRAKPDFSARFLAYVLKSEGFWEYIRGVLGDKSAQPNASASTMTAAPIRVPRDKAEQRAIAHVLGTLDDKIELNRRMNATLEAMARALFRSWFVDFDPVRAKMEGRDTGLPKDVADLFPDRLVGSELGEIPEGWIVKTLGDLCHKPQYGYTASARSEPVGPRFLRITDINKESWVSWSRVPYCEATDDEFSRYRLTKGDVLIARMADPGHGVVVEEDVEAVFASYLIRFRPIEDRNARFLQYWLRSNAYWGLVRGQAAGTTRVSLNARVLSLFPLVVPHDAVASAFAAVVGALRDRVVQIATEMRVLAELRDTLLPKLVSGELRVPGQGRAGVHEDTPASVGAREA